MRPNASKMARHDHSAVKVRNMLWTHDKTKHFISFCFSLFAEHIFQYQNKKDDDTERPSLDYVLDVTVAYPDNGLPLDLPTIVTGSRPACKTHFLYRLYHTSEVRVLWPFHILYPKSLFHGLIYSKRFCFILFPSLLNRSQKMSNL